MATAMRLPRTVSPLVALFALTGALRAQDEAPPLQVDVGYTTAQVFRGVKRAGDSLQAAVEFNRGGWRGGFWASQPFAGGDARESNLNAAYSWQLAAGPALELSAAHTWFGRVPGGGVERSLEVGLSATLGSFEGFTPTLAYYRDFRFDADTAQLSLARSIALTKLGAFLEVSLFAGLVDGRDWRPDAGGGRRRDNYGYWGGEAHLPYRVGPHSTIVAGLHYADSAGRSLTNGPFGRASGANLWVTLGVNLDF